MKEAAIRAVCERGIYKGKPLGGTLETTHISWVILASRYVFKIKKPLQLSFLDFSSLSKRKFFCEQEVALNRRLTDIYLDVIPVRKLNDTWRLGYGRGKIVDYAVRMKRMKSSLRMDVVLRSGKVDRAQIKVLAKSIASFHARAEVITSRFDPAFFRTSFHDIRSIKGFITTELAPGYAAIVSKAISWSDMFLRHHARRFRERLTLGFKRDLHGDLHTGNIFLYKRPVIFDCIEFNDAYRQVDVIDEVAFFCMDLESFGKKHLADFFVRAYARRFRVFETDEDYAVFNYYKCYRANVRAKVHAIAASQAHDPGEKDEHIHAVVRYIGLMEVYIASG